MNRIRIRRPGARSGRPWPGASLPGLPDPGIVRATGARAVRAVICAVTMAHHEQVRMWECVLLTSGAAPLTAVGPLRWVRSLDGYRLSGSHLPAQEQSETGPLPYRAPEFTR